MNIEPLPLDTLRAAHKALLHAVSRAPGDLELHNHRACVARHLEARAAAELAAPLIARDPRRPNVVAVRGRWVDCQHKGMPMCVDAIRNGSADARGSGFVPTVSPKAYDRTDPAARVAYRKDQRSAVNAKNRFADWLEHAIEDGELAQRVRRLVIDADLMVREPR